ncbi:MAG: crotonase/enoyl-CoA hydratase family protein [Solirubrobacterales bacterium]
MSGKRVDIEISDGVAEVTMTRAEKHNGLDYAMFEALGEAIDQIAADRSVRTVVLGGAGPSFCAGLDFAAFIAEGRPIEEMFARREGEPANFAQRAAAGWGLMPQPVIAAISGNCLGGGCQIALGADLRIAGSDLRMSVLEIKWGLIPDMGITRALPRLVGVDVAKLLTWTGRTLPADEALHYGLVTEIADDPRARARELAAEIATKSPDAIRRAKRLYDEAWTTDATTSLALEEELQRELLNSPNQIEAVRAALSGEAGAFED